MRCGGTTLDLMRCIAGMEDALKHVEKSIAERRGDTLTANAISLKSCVSMVMRRMCLPPKCCFKH